MQNKKYIIYFIIFLFSCNKLPQSTGLNNEITIVCSNEDKEYIKLALSPILEKNVYTPTIENLYRLNFIEGIDFYENRYKKNIIVCSLEHPHDSNIDLLSNKIRNQYNNESFIAISNLYAENQLLISIYSHDATKLLFDMNSKKNWIIDTIDENIKLNFLNDINSNEINKELLTKINSMFKINMIIDENYKLLKEDIDFIWIGRGYPYRWIVINQIDYSNNQNKLVNDSLYYFEYIDDLMEQKLTDVVISDYKANISGDILRGVYEHKSSQSGGPFFTYKYRNSHTDKLIFISGFVNNPGKSKAYLLLQLETIIKSIKEI